MKKILPSVLLFLFFLTSKAQENWRLLNPTPSYETGLDLQFISENKGFIITSHELLFTDDSGKTWNKKMQLDGAADINFLNNVGYIAGKQGFVLVTKNGGDSWTEVNTGSLEDFNSVQILNKNTIILSGSQAIIRSDDGGATWQALNLKANYSINKTYFTSPLIGNAACQGGYILKTIDGGQNWYVTESTNIYPNDFFTIYFANAEVGFATREHDDVLKTIDGGETWQKLSGTPDALYSFSFLNETIGYAAGEFGAIYKTVDGGNSWKWISFQNARYAQTSIHGIYFQNEEKGYAVGQRGMIFRTLDGGSNWEQYSPFYNDIHGFQLITDKIGYTSNGSTLFKTRDGGITWENLGAPVEGSGIGNWKFINENTGYALVGKVNYKYSVYKTVDGGQSWTITNDGHDILRENLHSLAFIDKDTGFVSGGFNQPGTFKTTNGGDSWLQVENLSFGEMNFPDRQTGYARQLYYSQHRIYKTSDTGENWKVVFEAEDQINSISFVSKEIGYIAGEYGTIYKTTNGGDTWEKLTVPYADYQFIKFITPNVGFASADNGKVWKTLDGGYSWQEIARIYGITSIDIDDQNEIFLAGTLGKILKSSFTIEPYTLTAGPAEEVFNRKATFTGIAGSNSESISEIKFEYGTDRSFNKVVPVTPDKVESNNAVKLSAKVTDLAPETTYQYRISAKAGGNLLHSQAVEFTTKPDYQITLNMPVVLPWNVVDLNGLLTSNEAEISDIKFQYGPYDNPFSQTLSASPAVVSGESSSDVRATLEDLNPDTKYLVRIKATYKGEVIYSNQREFTTYPEASFTIYPVEISENTASLSAYISAYAKDITGLVFEYGTQDFPNEISSEPNIVYSTTSSRISSTLTDLNPDEVYYYRVRGSIGDKNIYSPIGVFNISNDPIAVPENAIENEDRTVTVQGLINPGGKVIEDIRFEYGIDDFSSSVYAQPSVLNGNGTAKISAVLKDLIPGSTYTYRIKAVTGDKELISKKSSFVTKEAVQIDPNVLTLKVTNETCSGKNNGSILINAEEEHDFRLNINGEDHDFTSELLLENLSPGDYNACITAKSAPNFLECFEFKIEAGKSIAGTVQVQQSLINSYAWINIEEGTAPFLLKVNGKVMNKYNSKNFSVKVGKGDQLEISSKAACEGKLTFRIDLDESLTAYPNPVNSILNIVLPNTLERRILVKIYNNSGKLLSSKNYQVNKNVVSIPLDNLPTGFYFAVVNLQSPKTVKFSKK